MTKKERVDKLLKEAHLIINEASSISISKSSKDIAKRKAKQVWKKIKDIDPAIWDILKIDMK